MDKLKKLDMFLSDKAIDEWYKELEQNMENGFVRSSLILDKLRGLFKVYAKRGDSELLRSSHVTRILLQFVLLCNLDEKEQKCWIYSNSFPLIMNKKRAKFLLKAVAYFLDKRKKQTLETIVKGRMINAVTPASKGMGVYVEDILYICREVCELSAFTDVSKWSYEDKWLMINSLIFNTSHTPSNALPANWLKNIETHKIVTSYLDEVCPEKEMGELKGRTFYGYDQVAGGRSTHKMHNICTKGTRNKTLIYGKTIETPVPVSNINPETMSVVPPENDNTQTGTQALHSNLNKDTVIHAFNQVLKVWSSEEIQKHFNDYRQMDALFFLTSKSLGFAVSLDCFKQNVFSSDKEQAMKTIIHICEGEFFKKMWNK